MPDTPAPQAPQQVLRLHYAPDNASMIVRLALEELGLPYETVLVDRRARANLDPAYLRLNPNGLIPALETPQGAMFETAAILLWLSERGAGDDCIAGPALAPRPDAAGRAIFLSWLFWCSNTLHVDLRMSFYPQKYIGDDPADQAQLRAQLRLRLTRDFALIEQALADTPDLSARDAKAPPTLLDFYLPCLLRWCRLYTPAGEIAPHWFDLTRYPQLLALCLRAEARASTRALQAAEGLGPTPFSNPTLPNPPEGFAL